MSPKLLYKPDFKNDHDEGLESDPPLRSSKICNRPKGF